MPGTALLRPLLGATLLLSTTAGCKPRNASPPPTANRPGVIATVNGVEITEADLDLKVKGDMHQKELLPEHRSNVLEAVIRDELLTQQAIALGLDADPQYQAGLRALEAQVRNYKRRQLAERYMQHVAAEARPDEAEARRWFDAHAAELRTERHLFQIFVRDEGSITAAKRALDEGKPFEEVARGLLPPNLPPGDPPWDLGYMKWVQLPTEWRAPVGALKPGETSGVIRGPRSRYWIVKLVGVREAENLDFEMMKPVIVQVLQNDRMSEARERAERELRGKAAIEYRGQVGSAHTE